MSRRWRTGVVALALVGVAGCTGSTHHASPSSEFYIGEIGNCRAGHALRPGLDKVMVPLGAIAVTVCSEQLQFAGKPLRTHDTVTEESSRVVDGVS
jgi:hypothetical protein